MPCHRRSARTEFREDSLPESRTYPGVEVSDVYAAADFHHHRDRCPRSPCGALSSRITTVPTIDRLSRIVARQSRRNNCPRYRAPPRGEWKHHVRNVPAVCRPASCRAFVIVRFRQPGWECRRAVGKPAGSNTPPCTGPRCRRGTSGGCGSERNRVPDCIPMR